MMMMIIHNCCADQLPTMQWGKGVSACSSAGVLYFIYDATAQAQAAPHTTFKPPA
jgi:hypothetical protein